MGYGTWDGDLSHREQVFDREMEPDAEHEQAHTDLRKLIRDTGIGDESRRKRPNCHARDEVAEEEWQFELRGDQPKNEGESDPRGDGGDKGGFVIDGPTLPL